ncbi:MAG: TonB-dependent receptor [Prevotella sp.]|nr:TonB-dependent receptor [Prevotella sp.]
MNRHLLLIFLALLLPVSILAQKRISHEYNNVSLSDALKQLAGQQTDYTIMFLYNELEDFRITTTVSRKTLPDAIQQMIGFYPIRMTVDDSNPKGKKIFVECTHKADRHLTGTVIDELGQPIAYANIAILNPTDSTLLCGGVSNESGYFVIPYEQAQVLARISYVGYKTIYKICDQPEVGTIRMQLDNYTLKGVVVKGERPLITMKHGILTANIANTELANLGDARDVLSRLPLLNVSDESIEVFGKGSPLILIDNRKIRDASELQLLRSDNIKTIQIITMPGAEYGSTIRSVIKIQTKQKFIKGLSGTLAGRIEAKRIWQELAQANLSYSWGDWQLFGSAYIYDGGTRNYRQNGSTFDWAGTQNNSILHTATENQTFTSKNARGGFNYNREGQSFGGYYHYVNSPITFDSHGSEEDHMANKDDLDIGDHIYNLSRAERHTVSTYYDYQIRDDKHFHFDGSYVHTWHHADNLTSNTYADHTIDVPSQTGMHSTLWAGKIYYQFPLLKGQGNVGTEDSYTFNHQQYTMLNNKVSTYIPSSKNESRQYAYAAFATFTKDFGKLTLNVGLRWENIKFDYYQNDAKDYDVSRNQSSLSPDLSLSWQFNKETSMALDYKQFIVRPAYQQLRSSLLYVSPYEVEGGNPTLADCYNYAASYMFGWKGLILDVGYTYKKDAYVYTKEHYSQDSPQLIFSTHNEDYSLLTAYISFSRTIGLWKPTITTGVNKQWLTMYGDDYSRPIWEFAFKNMLIPNKDWLITCDITGLTRGHEMANDFHSRWGIDVSVRRYFLNKRLQINLSANDIFHTRNQEWSIQARDVVAYKYSNQDSRKLMLSITYSFNPKKSKYKGTSAGEAESKRL